MTNRLNSAVKERLEVQVDYYDLSHQRALDQYPSAAKIRNVSGKTISISGQEFFANAMFHRARHESVRNRNAEAQRRQVVHGYEALRPWIALHDDSLRLVEGLRSVPNEVAEHIGESIALPVVNRIFDLKESDWLPIGATNRKPSFDVQTASSGNGLIELEMKGSAVEDSDRKSQPIYQHKAAINEKKRKLAVDQKIERVGAIVAFPKNAGKAKCWLLDPEPTPEPPDPEKLKILSRLHFLRWIIWLVAPRSPFALSLANRIEAVNASSAPLELSGLPLIDASGEPLQIRYPFRSGADIPQFFLSRSHVIDGPAGGFVEPVDRDTFIFVGFRDDLLFLAVEQDFIKLQTYEAIEAVIPKTVRCVVKNSALRRFAINPQSVRDSDVGETDSRFDLSGNLAYTKEGLVFGELSIDSQREGT
jgi:hypothetical protein